MKAVLDPEHWRLGTLRGVLELPQSGMVFLGARILTIDRATLEVSQVSPSAGDIRVRVEAGGRRNGQGKQHASYGRVDAGLEDG